MHFTILSVLVLAMFALAEEPTRTTSDFKDMPAPKRHLLLPRQTFFPNPFGDVSDECVKAAEEFVESLPTLDPDLVQAIDVPTEEGCYTLPESLYDAFSSYSSEAKSWATAQCARRYSEQGGGALPRKPEFECCDGEDPNENLTAGLETSFGVAVGAAVAAALAL